ncbi:MAG: pantoate--beta-alanine ligase [Nitrospinae bacterium RIFCSPLOWO2_12_FULL_45_22]|nr:MAG: pantoate--beta-alanine ligase [Nitrospinae bacterium RIFCSPLOWO2_12_FULL_45_22]
MEIIKDLRVMQARSGFLRQEGKAIGFVPTMGYLHEGHLTLLRRAREENDIVVLSIFVNPAQFGAGEDYEKYPRDTEGDLAKASEAGTDIAFLPEVAEMYPAGYATYVNVEGLTEKLCGRSRPGHFRGVTTVVLKLFNLVQPHRAYFGEKDYQQLVVIKKMVSDLNLDLQIIGCPTVRESDGLAMSSRNAYLSPQERLSALCLSRSLAKAEELIRGGEKSPQSIINEISKVIEKEPGAKIDYVAVCHPETLGDLESIDSQALIALAVKIGPARLLDNRLVKVNN